MPGQYAPLPNPHVDPDAEHEMDAAFDDSDDEGDERRPLTKPTHRRRRRSSSSTSASSDDADSAHRPAVADRGTYDFGSTDYDHPPPGSPPPATRALANDFGNSNGLLPAETDTAPAVGTVRPRAARGGWLGRTAGALLPAHYARRVGLPGARAPGPVGGGSQNDGVFANVTAKPTRSVVVQDGDNDYVVPEDASKDHPPSYAAAQADAVPTYWQATTVHVPGADIPGEVMVDGTPTGTVFSFLWNALISVSFQFVGFLLTYLLHTTHAARYGARVGLGITLIQYGFALRRADAWDYTGGTGEEVGQGGGTPPPMPTFDNAKDQEDWAAANNVTAFSNNPDAAIGNFLATDSTGEWLAFFLMTIGWFLLLTSILGFWRVKRWERSILASTPEQRPAAVSGGRFRAAVDRMFEAPGLAGQRGALLRQGLGLGGAAQAQPASPQSETIFRAMMADFEPQPAGADEHQARPGQTQFIIDDEDPQRAQQMTRALVAEQRLNQDLRAAGLL